MCSSDLGHLEAALLAGIKEAPVSGPSCGQVPLRDADVGGLGGVVEGQRRDVAYRVIVIVVDAGSPLDVLAEDHERYSQLVHGALVCGREYRAHEDDAVHVALLGKEAQVIDLELLIIVGVGQGKL